MSAVTLKLLEIIEESEQYGLQLDELDKAKIKEIARQNVFFDYERMERDEPEIEFDEDAKQPEGVKLKTKFDKLNKGPRSTVYIGQGKLFDSEWTPHGVGI